MARKVALPSLLNLPASSSHIPAALNWVIKSESLLIFCSVSSKFLSIWNFFKLNSDTLNSWSNNKEDSFKPNSFSDNFNLASWSWILANNEFLLTKSFSFSSFNLSACSSFSFLNFCFNCFIWAFISFFCKSYLDWSDCSNCCACLSLFINWKAMLVTAFSCSACVLLIPPMSVPKPLIASAMASPYSLFPANALRPPSIILKNKACRFCSSKDVSPFDTPLNSNAIFLYSSGVFNCPFTASFLIFSTRSVEPAAFSLSSWLSNSFMIFSACLELGAFDALPVLPGLRILPAEFLSVFELFLKVSAILNSFKVLTVIPSSLSFVLVKDGVGALISSIVFSFSGSKALKFAKFICSAKVVPCSSSSSS